MQNPTLVGIGRPLAGLRGYGEGTFGDESKVENGADSGLRSQSPVQKGFSLTHYADGYAMPTDVAQ